MIPGIRSASPENQIRNLLSELAVAHVTQDVEILERIFADSLVYFNCQGKALNKAACLAEVASDELMYEEWDSEEVSIRVFGDTAITTSIERVRGQYNDEEIKGQCRLSLVFVKQRGRWQIVLGQETEIK